MASFLGGIKTVPKMIDAGTFHCPHCDRKRNCRIMHDAPWFHIVGLPILPMGHGPEMCVCTVCGNRYKRREVELL